MENKQRICDFLTETLKETRAGSGIRSIDYDEEAETATIIWRDSSKRRVNVAADSGAAMIRDIIQAIS